MRRKRAILIIGSFGVGGAEILVRELAKSLNKQSFEVEVWALSRYSRQGIIDAQMQRAEEKMVQDLEGSGVKTRILGKPYRRGRIRSVLRLREMINKFKPDIIHCHLERPSILTVLACLGLETPIIHTVHNTAIHNRWLYRSYLAHSRIQCYVAISRKVADVVKNLGVPPQKLRIVWNGVNQSLFKRPADAPAGIENYSGLRILSVGRLVEQKDHAMLLEALSGLEGDWRLYLIGTGDLAEPLLAQSVKLGLEGKVHFLGIRHDIDQFLGWADLYVLSSKWEGLSISLIEAASSGIPIVATDVGSNAEVIEHGKNGLLVPSGDPLGLREAMRQIMEAGFHSKPVDLSRFSIENMTSSYENLYSEVCNH